MKTVTIGKDAKGQSVTMEFMLIPAGTFVMGTPEPVEPVSPVDDRWVGRSIFSAGSAMGISLIVLMFFRAVRAKRWPQFSLWAASSALGLLLVTPCWAGLSDQGDAHMVPACPALNHDARAGAPPEIDDRAPQIIVVRELATIDRDESVTRPKADLLRAASRCPSVPAP